LDPRWLLQSPIPSVDSMKLLDEQKSIEVVPSEEEPITDEIAGL
jgi:hypothetical protein